MRQNPGFFDGSRGGVAKPATAPAPSTAPANAPKRVAKLTYKDQRRLEVLDALVHKLPGDIKAQEKHLEDPSLYAKDPAGFDRLMKSLDAMRAELHAAEEEWLALEEKREGLAGGE